MSTTATASGTTDRRETPAPPVRRRLVGQVARAEARRLIRHPITLVGVVLSGLLLWTSATGELPELPRFSTYVAFGLGPLAAASMLAAHLNASRWRRDDVDAIYTSAVATPTQRTIGHLAAVLAPALLAVVLAAGWLGWLYVIGGTGTPRVGALLTGPAVVLLGGVTGVAAATWLPNRAVGVIALVLAGGWQFVVGSLGARPHWLAFWHTTSGVAAGDLWIRPDGAHLAYLAGLTVTAAAVALIRHTRRASVLSAAAVGIAVVVVAAAVQLRPVTPAQLDEVADRIAHPDRYWTCTTHDDLRTCVFPTYAGWTDRWAEVVNETLEPVPADARPKIVIHQEHAASITRHQFSREVGATTGTAQDRIVDERLARHPSNRKDGWPIRVGVTWQRGPVDDSVLAVATGQRSAGLPTEFTSAHIPSGDPMPAQPGTDAPAPAADGGAKEAESKLPAAIPCLADGHARGPIALWLAGQSDPGIADLLRARASDLGPQAISRRNQSDPAGDSAPVLTVQWKFFDPSLSAGTYREQRSAVLWSTADVNVALQLLALPDEQVASAVAANWTAWTEPSTNVDVLIDHFDLAPPPTPQNQLQEAGLAPHQVDAALAAYPGDVDPTLPDGHPDLVGPPLCT